MPTRTVNDVRTSFTVHGLVILHRMPTAAGTVRLYAHDGFESFLSLAVVQQLLDTVHVTMIGQGYGLHARSDTFIHYLFHFGQAVQERVMAVYM